GARSASLLPAPRSRGMATREAARVAHRAEDDDFGLLLRYGADCIGAVGIRPPPGTEAKGAAVVTEVTASSGRPISGIQRKLLVTKRDGLFIPAGPEDLASYIAKFNSESERVGSLVRN